MRYNPTHEMVEGIYQVHILGWISEFPEENRPMIDGAIRRLGRERGHDDINTLVINTLVRIYPIPEGAKTGRRTVRCPPTWLHTAGTAHRLTIEFRRREDDRSYRQYVLSNPSAESESDTSEIIQFGDHQVSVLPSEALTADDAIAIFQFYYENGTVQPT